MRALSQTPYAAVLLEGPVTRGVSLGHGHVLVGGQVLSLTPPGALRMPNGIECALPDLESGAPVEIGHGRLECDAGAVCVGPLWDPTPKPRFAVSTDPGLESWPLTSLAGQGPGLTPLGDDIAIGYLAARALFGQDTAPDCELVELLAKRTTSLSATLLRLAARGQLPEAAHRLLEDGDPEPLLAWGATSGSGLLTGLGLYGHGGQRVVRTLELTLPLRPPRLVRIEISA